MIDTDSAAEIAKLTDEQLDAEMSAAFNACDESFGYDHEARGNANRRYAMLCREWKHRRLRP